MTSYEDAERRITYVCPNGPENAECAEATGTRDATENWDVSSQAWRMNDGSWTRPYCPNCGSDMDERVLRLGEALNLEGQFFF